MFANLSIQKTCTVKFILSVLSGHYRKSISVNDAGKTIMEIERKTSFRGLYTNRTLYTSNGARYLLEKIFPFGVQPRIGVQKKIVTIIRNPLTDSA